MTMLEPVAPVRPIAPYLGGKRLLAKRIGAQIARTPHDLYVEPFVGMGGVFFRRDVRPRAEVINDVSKEIATLFRILQRHYQQFLDVLKWQITSRAEFQRLIGLDPDTLTDLERAARFLYIQRLSFGGVGRVFGIDARGPARFDLTRLVPMLEDVHERLTGVTIECLDYAKLIRRYDRPDALFYCDPPYWGTTDYYGKGVFSEADFEVLRNLFGTLQGRFILSINDVPPIRELFAGFDIESVGLNYRASGKVTPARELIISGGS